MHSASLSSCEYFLFAGARVQDAKVIGLSEPSCMRRDNVASSPWGKASHAKMNNSSGSKCTRRSVIAANPSRLNTAFWALPHVQQAFFFSRLYRGAAEVARMGKQELSIVVH